MRWACYILAKEIRSRNHKVIKLSLLFKFLVLVLLLLFYPFSFLGVYYLRAGFFYIRLIGFNPKFSSCKHRCNWWFRKKVTYIICRFVCDL